MDHPLVVGREAELARLHKWLDQARHGSRQVVFVTGEAGLGKSTLIRTFMAQVKNTTNLHIGFGQCIEHYSRGEAYGPIPGAFERLCQGRGRQDLLQLMKQHSPSWLLQLPGQLNPDDTEALRRATLGATPQRMLREMATLLEVFTTEIPLVLVLGDLHWSDAATLDLLSLLARRQEPAKLLLLGTYRPEEVQGQRHPLYAMVQDLRVHKRCAVLPVSALSVAAIHTYLTSLRPESCIPSGLAPFIAQRAEGNPLFMVAILEHLFAQGLAKQGSIMGPDMDEAAVGIPDTLRQPLEHQFEQLDADDQAVLEVGSIAGRTFTAAEIAAGLDASIEPTEARCARLARHGRWLRAEGAQSWPDGTVSEGYTFVHALYQEVIYERLTAARRVRLHQRLGDVLEKAYHGRPQAIAAVLALHFEQGQHADRAVHYRQQAAENAIQRLAYGEAIDHLTRGIELVSTLAAIPEYGRLELNLLIALGQALIAVKGNAAPEVKRVYEWAQTLCQQIGDTQRLFQVGFGLARYHLVRRNLDAAQASASQCLYLAQQQQNPMLQLKAHAILGAISFFRADFGAARAYLDDSIIQPLAQAYHPGPLDPDPDARVHCDSFASITLWVLGYPERALKQTFTSVRYAQERAHPYSQAQILAWGAIVLQFRGDVDTVHEWAERLLILTTDYGYAQWRAAAIFMQGWVFAVRGQVVESITVMRQGIEAWRATGANFPRPWALAPLAEVYHTSGQIATGLQVVDEAFTAVSNGERVWEAELYRVKGELLLKEKAQSRINITPEACFQRALDIARQQQAKSWHLRAAMSLARLWRQRGKRAAAHRLLHEVYNGFTQGFKTADLKAAKRLLDELASEGR